MMTSVQDSKQRSPILKSVSRPCGTEGTVISAHVQLVSPYCRRESISTSVSTEKPSLSNGHLSPRNMPVLSPKYVKQLVSPNNRQSISNVTMPLLSPYSRQSLLPGVVQTVGTKRESSFSSRQLFTDNSQQLPTVNRQLSTNKGQIPSLNNLNHSAQHVDLQGYSLGQQNQLPHIAEVTGARRMHTLDQECQDQIPNACLSPSSLGPTTPTIANGIKSQSVVCNISIPQCENACGQQNYQGTGQVVHKLHNTGLIKLNFPQNPALNPSESGNQIMPPKVCYDGTVLEQKLRVDDGQNYNGLPVYDLTSPPGFPYTRPAADNSNVKIVPTNIVTDGNLVAGQRELSGHAKLANVNGTGDVKGTRNDQTGIMSGSVQQEEQSVSAQQHYKVTSMVTESRQRGQYTLSAPLGQQNHLQTLGQDAQPGPCLHQRMSSLQEQIKDLNVPQLPSPELLQSMMADNSPSKFVVMKMTESDKYVILSPEKSSTAEMVYKPMGSMKLPPGKYQLHSVNAKPLFTSSDQGQTTQLKIDITSPSDGAHREPKSKSEGEILKKKGSKCTKEKKESKKERKGKQQPNKVASTKKKNNKMEKKKNTANEKDKKSKGIEKKHTAQDKKPKSKPKKADDPKAKGKEKKPKSEPVVKKTEEKKENTICRVLSPCQKFCKAVLIFHNKAGRTLHTACNPVIFFTGGQFSESQDTPEVEYPVYLLTSDDNNHILAIMSEAFSPGQFLLSSQRLINFKDKFIPSDLQVKDVKNNQCQYHLSQAVLSPYHFTIASPMKGHRVILISQYKDFPIDTSPRKGTLDNPEVGERPNLISDVIDTWDHSYDITTMTPCTHPLYKVMNDMLMKKVEAPPKTSKFKLRVQLFDSRRKKRQKICDEI